MNNNFYIPLIIFIIAIILVAVLMFVIIPNTPTANEGGAGLIIPVIFLAIAIIAIGIYLSSLMIEGPLKAVQFLVIVVTSFFFHVHFSG